MIVVLASHVVNHLELKLPLSFPFRSSVLVEEFVVCVNDHRINLLDGGLASPENRVNVRCFSGEFQL